VQRGEGEKRKGKAKQGGGKREKEKGGIATFILLHMKPDMQ